ncbi:hypothetical protein [Ramlibacter sp. WS9]|uniref:hypothetical protein n=1 Tax=Ramlibacter sp. WS9 TaxID=1882741 RepID=UPI0011421345|nr:hypothetical protein [Ramlibacter sp. WS9]ROZ77641.1 hypothetical protein EEB15_09365 [Ramlibacter sp. WS9]
MNKHFFSAAFAAGLAAVGWVGWGFVGSSWLALLMTAVIGGVYLLGAFELRQFRAATAALASAMSNIPQPMAGLGQWLDKVPATLRNAVRLRVEGERSSLPGPALTPYLVGLLVMLGMLGTFLGMVVTFKGAVFALEGSTDLQAIRSALAAPIKGLGLSFGASVAGVAASAMLGLMSAISRRERLEVARQLDGLIAGDLRPFSLVHQREETFKALQVQARALPEVLDRLDAMTERIERRSQQLDEQLLERQAQFQREVTIAFTDLAHSVGASLKDSLEASARTAAESIRPVAESTLTQIAQESRHMQERLGDVAKAQVDALSQQFNALLASVDDSLARTQSDHALAQQRMLQAWADNTSEQTTRTARLLGESTELVRSRAEVEARWIEQHGLRMDQLSGLWRSELAALRHDEDVRGQAAVDRLGELQAAVARHLATLGAALEEPLSRLLQTASEVPQAASGVIAQLRQEMSRLAERDNLALQERTVLLEQLGVLLQTVNQAAGEQRGAIEAMLASASSVMNQAGTQFSQALDTHSGKAAEMAAHISGSAQELSGLAGAFGQSVQLFQASNEKLTESLRHIEASINRSTARSDEQLAYYVAQAREVIDLSISSQQGLFENLRQLQGRQGKAVALAAEERE